jgi:hypothetical protein
VGEIRRLLARSLLQEKEIRGVREELGWCASSSNLSRILAWPGVDSFGPRALLESVSEKIGGEKLGEAAGLVATW